ncbi:hypothetical protein BOX15_Mlig020735g1 [Macrostomum lignano]|uniref:Uncharacterized protein n=2 Tax=Macrostomum lignano TaxID=282301 RepID=A0A267H7X3_9PLAT|nr:hypothetical protein BOX15_Mlig020735g1 [Macrostomum lignano]
MQQQRRHYQQRIRTGPIAYEEKTRVIDFPPEHDQDAYLLGTPRSGNVRLRNGQPQRQQTRHSDSQSARQFDVTDYHTEDDGRQRSRVKTRPVVGHHYPAVRTRPQSQAPSVSNYTVAGNGSGYFENPLYESHRPISERFQPQQKQPPPPPSATVQSPVGKRVAAGNQRMQQQQQPQGSTTETEWSRQRANSESSFGGRLFFGWRRPTYEAAATQGPADGDVATAGKLEQQQPPQYRGKNLHNFSFTDAKIYSPQSQQQQQQQQRQILQPSKQPTKQNQSQQQQPRAKIWWAMETMGAVNSAHSNQMLLARGAPKAVKVQGDYC